MKRQHTPTERVGINAVERIVLRMGWIFREQPICDFGVDAHVEVCENGKPSGRLIALQIKAGESYFDEVLPEGFVYRGSSAHLEYWIGHSLPVLLILYHPARDEAWWCAITSQSVQRTPQGWHVTVPITQRLGESSHAALAVFAIPDFTLRQELALLTSQLSSPDGGAKRLSSLLDALAVAQREIAVSAPYFDEQLLWALSALARRGVRVRILSMPEAYKRLEDDVAGSEHAQLEWRVAASLHAKFIVIDQVLVVFGSANFNSRAWRNPVEHVLASVDIGAVLAVRDSFEELWLASAPPGAR